MIEWETRDGAEPGVRNKYSLQNHLVEFMMFQDTGWKIVIGKDVLHSF